MSKNKHLSFDDRLIIEQNLSMSKSFKYIGLILGKDCTTISKEIRNHYMVKKVYEDTMLKEINEDRIKHGKKPIEGLNKRKIMFDEETGEMYEK